MAKMWIHPPNNKMVKILCNVHIYNYKYGKKIKNINIMKILSKLIE